MTITGFGGLGEIGGNQFLIETNGSRLWVDFGLNFERRGKYYSTIQPRRYRYLQDLMQFKLIPDMAGLYRPDFVKHAGKTPQDLAFDGALFSHPHWDHVGFIPLLHPDLPIWCGETAKHILASLDLTSFHEVDLFLSYTEKFALRRKKRGEGFTVAKCPSQSRNVTTFRTGDSFDIDSFHIQPVHVDHSIPGAYGFIIENQGKTIVYTGDFRFHGPRADMTEDFVQAAECHDVDVLLCEGTRIVDSERISEEDVRQVVSDKVRQVPGLVLANFPVRDLDRLRTFWEVARQNDRILVIGLRQAALLKQLEQDEGIPLPRVDDPHIAIYVKRKGWGHFGNTSFPETIQYRGYFSWEKEFLTSPGINILTDKDISQDQQAFVLYCSFYDLAELGNIRPVSGSHYIRSVMEAFSDEMELDQRVERAWLEHFGLWPITQIHAGGHASQPEIHELVSRINPKTLIPIHTQAPNLFAKLHSNVQILERHQSFQF